MKKTYCMVVALAILAGGCADGSEGSPPPPPMTQTQVDQNIEKIKNDPKLSEQQKQMAINGIKAAAEMQQRLATQASQGKPGSTPPK